MDNYIGVFSSLETLTKPNIEELKELPTYFILQQKQVQEKVYSDFKDKSDVSFYRYSVVNKNGIKETLQIGQFEIIDIGPDSGSFHSRHREVIIKEAHSEISYNFKFTIKDYKKPVSELIEFFKLLKIAGTWAILTMVLELRDENEKLIEKLDRAQKRESKLKAELEACQLKIVRQQ